MKCGWFSYKEQVKPYTCIYSCNYFGTIAPTEKDLCEGCYLYKSVPHLESIKKWNCVEDSTKCFWWKRNERCIDCEYIKKED